MPTPPALQWRWFAVQDLFGANGWNVRSFDISNGWDFEKAAHRRAFHELQDLECPTSVGLRPHARSGQLSRT